ncbi:MAG TPA: hypothetical protein PKA21_15000 [Kiritimatiellia bacterium]|nr:hypothetical protein [Kiritimatiellia bacterium]
MPWNKRESAYDRRIRELEEEAERIRKNMQQLMKTVPRDGVVLAAERPAAPRPSGPGFRRPPAVPDRWAETRPGAMSIAAVPDDAADAESQIDTPMEAEAATQAAPATPGRGSRPEAPQAPRLASYLASGSFGKSRTLSRDRRIQRNKAIMMLIFAVIAVYSLYTWLK